MPKVKGKKYDYDAKGIAAAKEAMKAKPRKKKKKS